MSLFFALVLMILPALFALADLAMTGRTFGYMPPQSHEPRG